MSLLRRQVNKYKQKRSKGLKLIFFFVSVCFMGVLIGLMPGSWLCNRSEYCQSGLTSSVLSTQIGVFGILFLLAKLLAGKLCTVFFKDKQTTEFLLCRCRLLICLAYCL